MVKNHSRISRCCWFIHLILISLGKTHTHTHIQKSIIIHHDLYKRGNKKLSLSSLNLIVWMYLPKTKFCFWIKHSGVNFKPMGNKMSHAQKKNSYECIHYTSYTFVFNGYSKAKIPTTTKTWNPQITLKGKEKNPGISTEKKSQKENQLCR